MRYRDVGVASEWLCAAFGFEPHFAAKAPDGAVFYAELRLGDSMIMLGAVGEPSLDAVMKQPNDADEAQTQSCYVVIPDVEDHYNQAKRAGAAVVLDLKSDDLGGRGYSCRDLEGHVWNFGTYDPWKAQSNAPRSKRRGARQPVPGLRAAIALTLLVSVVSGWFVYGYARGPADGLMMQRLRDALLGDRKGSAGSELSTGTIARPDDTEARAARAEASKANKAMASLKDELERERRAKSEAVVAAAAARAAADKAEAGLAERAKIEKTQATRRDVGRADVARTEGTVASLRADLERERAGAEKSVADLKSAQDELGGERSAKEAALKSAADAQASLQKEKATKESALQALADAGARIATLEVELKAAHAAVVKANAARSLQRMRAVSAARARVPPRKKKENEPWPYSEW